VSAEAEKREKNEISYKHYQFSYWKPLIGHSFPANTLPPLLRSCEVNRRGRLRVASIIGRTCAFDAKNRRFFESKKFVTTYGERSKNFFKNLLILQKLPTDLIEK
jgi:hypothetical protein